MGDRRAFEDTAYDGVEHEVLLRQVERGCGDRSGRRVTSGPVDGQTDGWASERTDERSQRAFLLRQLK
ncbi:hypothetical protein GCM10027269_40520 [Kribbella endophytica]